jgi:CRP-like cAMP-binding protein
LRLVDAVPLFASLTQEEREALATTMVHRSYAKGETLVERGAKLSSLFIIRSGVLSVSRPEGDTEAELRRLSPGDYFGEGGLFAGRGEPGTVRALTFAIVYEVGQAALGKIMRDRPAIADEISMTLSARAETDGASPSGEEGASSMRSVSWLVARIRSAFLLQ